MHNAATRGDARNVGHLAHAVGRMVVAADAGQCRPTGWRRAAPAPSGASHRGYGDVHALFVGVRASDSETWRAVAAALMPLDDGLAGTLDAHVVPLDTRTLLARQAACVAYATQLKFQFGGDNAARTALAGLAATEGAAVGRSLRPARRNARRRQCTAS